MNARPDPESLTGSTSTTETFAYDGLGQRATTTDGTSRHSYGYDPHGSVSTLINQNAGVDASYSYSAYGATSSKAGTNFIDRNPYTYTGKRFDTGSGTYDMGARRYSPAVGRWLQQDFYYSALDNFSLSRDPLSSNRYLFTGANPINFVELDGHILGPAVADGGGKGPLIPELYHQEDIAISIAFAWSLEDCKDPKDSPTCAFLWDKSLDTAQKIDDLNPFPSTDFLDASWGTINAIFPAASCVQGFSRSCKIGLGLTVGGGVVAKALERVGKTIAKIGKAAKRAGDDAVVATGVAEVAIRIAVKVAKVRYHLDAPEVAICAEGAAEWVLNFGTGLGPLTQAALALQGCYDAVKKYRSRKK